MPELPEVETIKRGLAKKLVGKTITSIEVLNPKSFQGSLPFVLNQKILSIFRRAKMLGIDLENGMTFLIHLKMSGQLLFSDGEEVIGGGHPTPDMFRQLPNKSTRIIIMFSDKSRLFFNDQRKFGWIKVIPTDSLDNGFFSDLGPEPLERSFTLNHFVKQLDKHPNWEIKVALLDQTIIAGIGNIYASEACFNAGISPLRKVSSLSTLEFKRLFQGVKKALETGILHGGSSREHYVDASGKKGSFLTYAFVYNREGESCKICMALIKRIPQRGRSTFYCPVCQK